MLLSVLRAVEIKTDWLAYIPSTFSLSLNTGVKEFTTILNEVIPPLLSLKTVTLYKLGGLTKDWGAVSDLFWNEIIQIVTFELTILEIWCNWGDLSIYLCLL